MVLKSVLAPKTEVRAGGELSLPLRFLNRLGPKSSFRTITMHGLELRATERLGYGMTSTARPVHDPRRGRYAAPGATAQLMRSILYKSTAAGTEEPNQAHGILGMANPFLACKDSPPGSGASSRWV